MENQRSDEILGYKIGEQVLCTHCVMVKEIRGKLKESQIIRKGKVRENVHYYCDRCSIQIS